MVFLNTRFSGITQCAFPTIVKSRPRHQLEIMTRDILPATSENLPATRDPRRFDSHAIFGLSLLPLSSSAPTPPRRGWAARPYSHCHTQFLFRFGPTFLSSFVVTFKKRCLYSFIGICGTWMHRFAFWKFYLKPGLITSFRSALRSVRMEVRKHWSLSGWLIFSIGQYPVSRVASIFRLI